MTDTTQDTDVVARAADRLAQAAATGTPCAPVRDLIGADNIDSAYAVQRQNNDARLAAGARVVGRKIGLTSPAVQAQLGVDRPDFGVLFADMDVSGDEQVDSTRLLQAKTEAEVAFVLSTDLTEGPFDDAQIRAAVDYATAALEIVDSRIAGWDITFGDTVADNASSGLYVLGNTHLTLDDFAPIDVPMSLQLNGETVSTGNGAACLGDPLIALAWLARTAAELGDPLRAGDVVLSGALGPMVATPPGSVVTADLGPLGTVSATFTAPTTAPSGGEQA